MWTVQNLSLSIADLIIDPVLKVVVIAIVTLYDVLLPAIHARVSQSTMNVSQGAIRLAIEKEGLSFELSLIQYGVPSPQQRPKQWQPVLLMNPSPFLL